MTALLLLLFSAPALDPAGVPGEILLVSGVPEEAVAHFARRAGDGKVIVLTAGKDGVLAKLKAKLKPEVRPIMPTDDDGAPDLSGVAAVWIGGDNVAALRKHLPSVEKGCLALLRRGGIVAFSGAAFPPASLLPDAAPTAGKGVVGYGLEDGSALSIRGRQVRPLVGVARLSLLAGNGRPARTDTLKGDAVADLTVLRRCARDRAGPAFPAEKPAAPVVEKGTLVIVGGGGMPRGLIERFVQLAGGKKAKIVVLPTAMPGVAAKDGFGEACKKFGAEVTLLPGSTAAQVESEEYLKAMREATGVWFGGGRQWRFVDAYEGTKLLPLMHDVLARGGVIGGSSAGATIQGEYLCRGGVFENFAIASEGYERGFAFLPGTAIDQHFAQRKRFADMESLMARHPQLLGIGLDEATAIIVKGGRADVTGRGEAHFYAGKAAKVSLKDGAAYDLKARKPAG